jgi:hypothetical protein
MTETATEPMYELRADNTPDIDGGYFCRVYLNGSLIGCSYRQDRDEAIAKSRAFVAWHRDRDTSYEVIAP